MILLKLGGSVITNKERPLCARKKPVDAIIKVLKAIREPVVLVHGGGSYGHYWSVKYDMHTRPAEYGLHGVAVVKDSMIRLNGIVLESMLKNGQSPYPVPPSGFMDKGRPIVQKIMEMGRMAKSGLVPVTYGDALWHGGKKSYILSGDRIMTHIAGVLRPRLTVFALAADGVYSDPESKILIREMAGRRPRISEVKMDVTGGMSRKIQEASKISRMGLRVFFANGNRPERIANAVNRSVFEGTLFGGAGHG